MTQPTTSPLPLDQVAAVSCPGDEVGRYRLVRKIGQGGMGQVWLAHDPVLAIDVALKMIRVAEVGAQGAQRLLREARAAAQISHEGIVRVLDFGNSSDGMSYLVMELLQGESIADLLDRERCVEPVRAVQIMLPLLDALAVAHERGIIHRDLKPENLFLSQDSAGRTLPKILDFGIAKADLTPGRLTRTGIVMGTPAFMAPEQVRGEEPLDASADLWSLTVSLYEMLAGKLPFADNDYAALLWAICNQAPPSLAGQRGVDDELWSILERGLNRDRAERWSTARAYAEALAGWLLKQGVREDISGGSRLLLGGAQVRRSHGSIPAIERQSLDERNSRETAEAPTERASALAMTGPQPESRMSTGSPRLTANTEAVPVPRSVTSEVSVPGISRELLVEPASLRVPLTTPVVPRKVGIIGAVGLGVALLAGAAWSMRSSEQNGPLAAGSPVVVAAADEPSSVPTITIAPPMESVETTPVPVATGAAARAVVASDPYSRVSARQEPARAVPPPVPASTNKPSHRPGKGNWY